MEIKTFSIGDHVWLMKDNAVAECEVIAIAIDCFSVMKDYMKMMLEKFNASRTN